MTYQELREALEIFGLGEQATRDDIVSRHRMLVKKYHPDAGAAAGEEMAKVNAAHRVLQDYIGNYRFLFSEDEFYRQNPEERVRQQFSHDPLWGDNNP